MIDFLDESFVTIEEDPNEIPLRRLAMQIHSLYMRFIKLDMIQIELNKRLCKMEKVLSDYLGVE